MKVVHYSENMLAVIFVALAAFALYAQHSHNDQMASWALQWMGNVLSALFGVLQGTKQAPSNPTQP